LITLYLVILSTGEEESILWDAAEEMWEKSSGDS